MSGSPPSERIERGIVVLRGHQVLLSTDRAERYAVAPRVLVQAVKRNMDSFPDDVMFQLAREELRDVKSHCVISRWGGLRRAAP